MSNHYESWREGVLKQWQEKIAPERIEEIFQRTTIFGSSNGWTGTAGTLAADCRELMREREFLLEQIKHMRQEFSRLGRVYTGTF